MVSLFAVPPQFDGAQLTGDINGKGGKPKEQNRHEVSKT
jgi:hypothetical protein